MHESTCAMVSLLSLPTECILYVFKNCESLSQAITLSSTCKLMYSIFSSNLHSILYSLGTVQIFAFKDALMTARATQIVLDHFRKSEFPPDPFPLNSLSCETQRLSPEEFRLVLDWVHLAKCIENVCLKNTEWGKQYGSFTGPLSNSRGKWMLWKENFHRSIYRVFLMGAVLCRAYQEPLAPPSGAGERPHRPPPHFLHDFPFANWGAGHADVEYLLGYPILKFEAHEAHGPIYGPLADFLFQQSKMRAQSHYIPRPQRLVSPQEATIPDYMDETHASMLYTETLGCLFAFLTLSDKPYRSVVFKDPRSDESNDSRLNRKITVVPLDRFHPMEIFMPDQAQDAHHTLLLKLPVFSSNCYYMCVPQILYAVYARSGQPNHYLPDYRTAWPPLQTFEFILRKFLDLRFDQLFFSTFHDQGVAFFVRDSGDIYHEDYSQWPAGAYWVFGGVDGEYNGYDSYFVPMN